MTVSKIAYLPLGPFARAWKNVALAMGDDPERDVIHQAIHVEFYPDGINLVAANGVAMLHSFVPIVGTDSQRGRQRSVLHELPDLTVTAIDSAGRAGKLVAYMLKLAKGSDEFTPAPVDAILEVVDGEPSSLTNQLSLSPEMEPQLLRISCGDRERVNLACQGRPWLTWRALYRRGEAWSHGHRLVLAPEVGAITANLVAGPGEDAPPPAVTLHGERGHLVAEYDPPVFGVVAVGSQGRLSTVADPGADGRWAEDNPASFMADLIDDPPVPNPDAVDDVPLGVYDGDDIPDDDPAPEVDPDTGEVRPARHLAPVR